MPFNAWSHVFEDGFDGKYEDISMRNEDLKMNVNEKKGIIKFALFSSHSIYYEL